MTKHEEKAYKLFMDGYNCSQSVAAAFEDVLGLDVHLTNKMMSSFGGGVGRLREVCGAVSGMAFVAGILYGYEDNGANGKKKEHYERIQQLCHSFGELHGSIVCKSILGNNCSKGANPTERTNEFYTNRPCLKCVCDAARILDEYIEENPIK